MASPPTPPTFEDLAGKRFSFYPPIVGIEHNEWTCTKSNWSELLVVNAASGAEIWISTRFLGAVSRTEEPVVIVGLNPELEYRGGMLCTHQRRVIPMPGAPPQTTQPDAPAAPESNHWMAVHGIRMEPTDRRAIKLIGLACACFIAIYLGFVGYNQWDNLNFGAPKITAANMGYQELSGKDDYFSVIRKLGQPSVERNREVGTIQFQALQYPKKHYTVLLMGPEIKSMAYIGTLDDSWRPIHTVRLAGSTGTTDSLLRSLQRF